MQPDVRSFGALVIALVFAGGLVGTLGARSEAQQLPDRRAPCPGEIERRYQDYPWDFTTNSISPPQSSFTFLHCVHNNTDGVVDIDWLIPKVKQFVAPKESGFSPRFSPNPPLQIADGCLIYGNLQDRSVKASFWARQEDKLALDAENKIIDCIGPSASVKEMKKGEFLSPKDMLSPFRIFLPADQSSPETTLVAFEGETGIRSASPRGYESFVTYSLRPAENGKAESLDAYRIVPRWSGEVERLLEFYKKAGNPPSLPLSAKGTTIKFFVDGSGQWTFHELEYQLFPKDKTDVAAILHLPVFVPAQ
jgi:hypothetical protein